MNGRPSALLMTEAGIAMIAASLAIRFVPVARLASWMRGRTSQTQAPSREIEQIVRAIRAWSRRLPWRTMCFEEGLSAHWMLRRRGLASTLHYGAATIDGELKAHVWVRSGSSDVTGCETASRYALLARFPGS
jgi:hypothetical protein